MASKKRKLWQRERPRHPLMAQETLPGTTDRRLAGLLTLLAENATIVVSGARIAKEIGVSRSTVWRWVTRLRELGVRVKGQQRTGYFLEQVPDILTPDMLRQRLKGCLFGKRIYHFFKTDSTNRVALEPGQLRFVIVGIGLNVTQEKSTGELGAIASFLRVETGKPQSRLELLVRLLREFENDYNQFLREGAASVTQKFAAISSYAKGKRVRVTNGTESFAGTTDGLGPEGLLRGKRDEGDGVTVIAGGAPEAR